MTAGNTRAMSRSLLEESDSRREYATVGTVLSGVAPANGPWVRVLRVQTSGLVQGGTGGTMHHSVRQAFTVTLPLRQPDQAGDRE